MELILRQSGHRSWPVWILALVWMVCGVAELQAGQPVPTIDVTGFEPEIRRQILTAHRAVMAQPRAAEANGKLGMILQAYERYEQAALFLDRAHRLDPADFRWAFYLGVVRAELGRSREAIDVLEVARRLRPEHLPTRLRLAEALLADGQTAPSQVLFEAVRKERPAEATPLYGLGRIAVMSGQREQAIDYFRQAIAIFPTYGAVHYAYGLVLRDLGQTAAARHHLTLSQEHRLERPVIDDPFLAAVAELNLGATLYLTRGRALEAAGKIDESIAAHEKALERRPGLVQAHLNLITLYGRRGQIEAAQRHYLAALAINPALPELHYNHGVLLVTRGEVRRAAEAFLETLRLNPFHPEAHHNLGVIIEQEGRLDEAAEHYRKALREKPGYRSAHFHLGRIYVNQGRVREGLAEFQAALAPPPAASDEEAPGYFYALGATWSMVGERSQSIAMLREALRRATLLRQRELAEAIRRDLQTLGDK